ncbi:MAG: glycosyltransferase family 1 protein [Methanomassiliicoccales archaeon]|nr:glycosyltransferase family 1 protein [Methanomassiliicoccales archaeon]
MENGWVKPERVSVLLNGFDPASHHPIPGTKKDIDVLFYGAITPRRQKILDELGKKHSIYHIRWLGEEMTDVVNRSKILLNIHAEEFLDTETRIYEGLGWGAFILSEKLSEDDPFVPGQHFAEIQNVEEMSKAIDYYLKNEAEREMIASQGHQEAMSKHTYDHRAVEIIEAMKPYMRSRDSPAIDREQLEHYRRKESVLRFRYQIGNRMKSVLKR